MDGFNPCEIFQMLAQGSRMARLLQMLRDSQASCTDTDCITPNDLILPSDRSPSVASGSFGLWTLFAFWVLIAAVLYVHRPTPRSHSTIDSKRQPGQGNQHDDEGPSVF